VSLEEELLKEIKKKKGKLLGFTREENKIIAWFNQGNNTRIIVREEKNNI
jgi:hypothetical protein